MNCLIIYSSNSGSTKQVAKIINKTIAGSKLIEASKLQKRDLENIEVIIMGSPSWYVNKKEGQPHEDILMLLENVFKSKDTVGKFKWVFFGCGDSSYLQFCKAVDIMENHIRKFEGEVVFESLKIDGFFFNLEDNITKAQNWANKFSQVLNSKAQ
jgi:flavodoxin I